MTRLSTRRVQSLNEPGMYNDGNGLYLRVGPTGGKSWVLRTVVYGRRRDLGIGSASLVTLAEARESAQRLRKVARAGGDPDAVRKRETLTFEEAAKRVHQSLLPTWRSERHGQIWWAALARNAFPLIGRRPIATIGTADILHVLEPIWTTKFDTANRIKQRLSSIFDWAKGAGHYPHENPVNGVTKALPNFRPLPAHMAALPWQNLPSFTAELGNREGTSARALEFLILTAARSGEVRGTRWSEIDGNVWTIPADRMKSNRLHRVPLSTQALSLLAKVRGLDPNLIFPSPNRDRQGNARQMSDTVFKALMDRMKRTGLTTHGFRSTFRDWCSECAHAAELRGSLSHSFGNKVERAYARSDLFERRRTLMEILGTLRDGRTWAGCPDGSKMKGGRESSRAENRRKSELPLAVDSTELPGIRTGQTFRKVNYAKGTVRLSEMHGIGDMPSLAADKKPATPKFVLPWEGMSELNSDHGMATICGILMDADLWILGRKRRASLLSEIKGRSNEDVWPMIAARLIRWWKKLRNTTPETR